MLEHHSGRLCVGVIDEITYIAAVLRDKRLERVFRKRYSAPASRRRDFQIRLIVNPFAIAHLRDVIARTQHVESRIRHGNQHCLTAGNFRVCLHRGGVNDLQLARLEIDCFRNVFDFGFFRFSQQGEINFRRHVKIRRAVVEPVVRNAAAHFGKSRNFIFFPFVQSRGEGFGKRHRRFAVTDIDGNVHRRRAVLHGIHRDVAEHISARDVGGERESRNGVSGGECAARRSGLHRNRRFQLVVHGAYHFGLR